MKGGPGSLPPLAVEQPLEQLLYARVLQWGARVGLGLLVLLFGLYAAAVLPPQVSLERLPALWSLPVADYLRASGTPAGWGWLALAAHGDVATLLGIVLLAGCSLPALAVLLPGYWRRRDWRYLALGAAEIGVLLLAASGTLTVGH